MDRMYLSHIDVVLDRLGFDSVDGNSSWDLLWCHPYPFVIHSDIMENLKPHQRVNHFPGTYNLTNKVDLCASEHKYVAKSFRIPQDKDKFEIFRNKNPNASFVQKNNRHRQIEIIKIENIDFNNSNSFIQHYLDTPLLIGGYKFDIGIFTLITSVNPLRAYIYNSESLFRFCPTKYHPFDPEILDKYIVRDHFRQIWEIDEVKPFFKNLGFGLRESFNAYLRSIGHDPQTIWTQIEEIIRYTLYMYEQDIINAVSILNIQVNFNLHFKIILFFFCLDRIWQIQQT